MKIPFTDLVIEKRADTYSDAIRDALATAAQGIDRAKGKVPIACEIAASLWASAFESAKVTPANLVTDALTPEVLNTLGRQLCLEGDVVLEIQVADGVRLVPACNWEVTGGDAWSYSIELAQPSQTVMRTVTADQVVHIRDGANTNQPWRGRGLLQRGRYAVTVAALIEAGYSEEFSLSVGQLIPLPANAGTDKLQADINSLGGDVRLVESVGGNWDLGSAANSRPIQDWTPKRIGPNPPVQTETLYGSVNRHILALRGVSPSLLGGSDGTFARESYRQFLHGAIMPAAKLVAHELSAKLEVDGIGFDFSDLFASDITGRARAFQSLVGGGMSLVQAASLSGLLVQDDD